MRTVFIDIETIPTQHLPFQEFIRSRHLAKKSARKDADEVVLDSSKSGTFGEVLSIAWAIDDEPIKCLYRANLQPFAERMLLEQFAKEMRKVLTHHTIDVNKQRYEAKLWVGHNVKDFDLSFLRKRFFAHRIDSQIDFNLNKRDGVFDTKFEWDGYKASNFTPLAEICMALNIPVKSNGLTGDKVWDAALEGRFEEIAEYNCEDVEAVRQIYKVMRHESRLAGPYPQPGPLDDNDPQIHVFNWQPPVVFEKANAPLDLDATMAI